MIAALLLSVLLGLDGGLSGLSIALAPEARVRGTEIRLGDVAAIEGADAALVARARALELGYAPAPGYSRLLELERIAAQVERELGPPAFAGSRACRVWPLAERVSAETLRAAAAAELARALEGVDATSEPIGNALETVVPQGLAPAGLRVRPVVRPSYSGVVSVPVEVLVDGSAYHTVWTSWRVQIYQTLPVLARPVSAGEQLTPELFQNRRVAVDGPGAGRALVGPLVLGAVAARDLCAGAPVTSLDVHRPIAVRAGDMVSLEVRSGAVSARVAAVARHSGAIGDRVRVAPQNGGEELVGLLVARELVRIELGAPR